MRRALLVLVLLASCADPVTHPGSRTDRQQVLPPVLKPPDVIPADPEASRPYVGSPAVDPPQVRPPRQVDLFRQSQAIIDILWVIDDTGSMIDERQLLADNFPRFLSTVIASKADFRIGVTTSDIVSGVGEGGKLRGPFIDATTADPQGAFEAQVTITGREMSGVRWTAAFEAARRALLDSTNRGFVRPEAALAVIFISDEDDQSFGTTDHFVRYFRSFKGAGNENRVSASAIAGPVPGGCVHPGEETWLGGHIDPSLRLKAVVDGTGGAMGSICDTDFASSLQRIALALNTLKKEFPLSFTPLDSMNPTRFEVRVDETPDDSQPGVVISRDLWEWRAGTNSVVFTGSYIPPPRSLVQVDYDVASSGAPP